MNYSLTVSLPQVARGATANWKLGGEAARVRTILERRTCVRKSTAHELAIRVLAALEALCSRGDGYRR